MNQNRLSRFGLPAGTDEEAAARAAFETGAMLGYISGQIERLAKAVEEIDGRLKELEYAIDLRR